MLDFGFSEILLTSAIALVVLGPERLPKVARQVGNWMGRARLMARQLSEQLEREVNAEEILRTQAKALMADTPRPVSAPPAIAAPEVAAEPPTFAPEPAATMSAALPSSVGAPPPPPLPVDRYESVRATSAAAMHQETSAAALHPTTPPGGAPSTPGVATPGVATPGVATPSADPQRTAP